MNNILFNLFSNNYSIFLCILFFTNIDVALAKMIWALNKPFMLNMLMSMIFFNFRKLTLKWKSVCVPSTFLSVILIE